MTSPKYGIDVLRGAIAMANACNESFNQRFSTCELIELYNAYKRSAWDILPDRWTESEVKAALKGKGTGARSER